MVVGNDRTDQDESESWMTAAGNTIKEGNINEKQVRYGV